MAPASCDIDQSDNIMRLPEELVPSPSNDRPQAEEEEEADCQCRYTAKNHILLSNEVTILLWLRLVEIRLHDSPHDSVQD